MKATTAINNFDHNDECIGCGASTSASRDCDPECPIQTGEITAPVVLRYAAKLLTGHPMGVGYDIRESLFSAAQALTGEPRPCPLYEQAVRAVCEHLSTRHPESDLSGGQMLYRTGLFVPVAEIALTLYATAAAADGIDFDPEEFGDFR